MSDAEAGKRVVQEFLTVVWRNRALDRIAEFWTEDCVNHAHAPYDNRGLDAIRAYHEPIIALLDSTAELRMTILNQVAEGDLVATHISNTVRQIGPFMSWPAKGETYTMQSMRFDRIRDGKIAEHWTLADVNGLMAFFARSRS
jgi:predicted SnoaL-like aldol condensation-catalyzing enzyme